MPRNSTDSAETPPSPTRPGANFVPVRAELQSRLIEFDANGERLVRIFNDVVAFLPPRDEFRDIQKLLFHSMGKISQAVREDNSVEAIRPSEV